MRPSDWQVVINQLLGDIRPEISDTLDLRCRAILEGCWAQDAERRPAACKVRCCVPVFRPPCRATE